MEPNTLRPLLRRLRTLKYVSFTLILLLCAPLKAQITDEQSRAYQIQGLESVPFIADSIGLSLHLPQGAHVAMREVGDQVQFMIGDGPDPKFWRIQLEQVSRQLEGLSEPADPGQILGRILGDIGEHTLISTDITHHGDLRGAICFVNRFLPPNNQKVVNGWLVIPNGRYSALVFNISLMPELEERIRPLLESSFATIKVKTVEERSLGQRSRIENGRTLIDSITPAQLRELVGLKQWFRSYRPASKERNTPNTELACSVVEVFEAKRGALNPSRAEADYNRLEREEGIMVRVQGRVVINAARDYYFDTLAMYWLAWDMSSESWSVLGTQRRGQAERTEYETGIRSAATTGKPIPQLTVTLSDFKPQDWSVPDVYLSQPLAWLLGRLLPHDSDEPQYFSYYFYNSREAKPSLTLRYDRWEPANDGTGNWKLATMLSKKQPPDVSTYAPNGSLIRRVRSTGDITVPTTREYLLKLWKSQGLRTGPASQ